jgi:hypothetical protein
MKNIKEGTKRWFLIGLMGIAAVTSATAVTNGTGMLNNLTIPYGGAWIPGSLGGHFWQPDTVNGVCRVDKVNSTSNCRNNATSPGQIAVGSLPGGPVYLFVPDASTTSTRVVRFVFDPVKETLGATPLIISVPNVTSTTKVGGAVAAGRPSAVALDAAGNLYVGYTKSGDIMKVPGALSAALTATPSVSQVGSTSDGRGVNALLFFGNDLYLAETGGQGVSRIPDPSGVTRPACSPAAVCAASPLNPQVSFFPGALATDNINLYVGDAPLTTPGSVLKYDPTQGISATNPTVYSLNVPSYKANFDNVTRTQYVGIRGLAFAPNGDLYVADDPTANLVLPVLPTRQGNLWKVAYPATPLSITNILPTSGPGAGGTSITLTGAGFGLGNTVTKVSFGGIAAQSVNCATVTSCVVITPAVLGGGTVPVQVTVGAQTAPAGSFTFNPAGVGQQSPTITSILPNIGLPAGGTQVTVTGTNLLVAGQPTSVVFGLAGPGTVVSCTATQCIVRSPAFAAGIVDIQLNVNGTLTGTGPADKFTYANATATLFAWGITAPKGGMTFVPGNLPSATGDSVTGGHMWSSDHSQGFCRHDLLTPRAAGLGTPASAGSKTLHAMSAGVCDDGSIGSPGQAVYDPRVNPALINTTDGRNIPAGTHYIYVPDNAVKSTAVWRLTFDPNTETIVAAPEAMVPLADLRTLKPNGMALGPDGNLYVTDLVEMNIRKLTNPNGDPRLQTIQIVAVTGDGRGANGTVGFIGNQLYISENRAASWFDITTCPTVAGPCATTPIPLPSGAFIAGVATDPVRNYVYAADSPGGANATIWRFDLNNPLAPAIPYLTGGQLPVAGVPESTVWISQTGVRPWNPQYVPGGTAKFSFAFGISVDARNGDLYVTEDPLAGARGGFGSAWVAKLVQ